MSTLFDTSQTEQGAEQERAYTLFFLSDIMLDLPYNHTFNFGLYSGSIGFDQDIDNDGANEFSINKNNFSNEVIDSDFFIRELSFAKNEDTSFYYNIGKRHQSLGAGFIYDDYVAGISTHFDVSTYRVLLSSDIVEWRSPLASVGLKYYFDKSSEIEFAGHYFYDNGNNLSSLITDNLTLPVVRAMLFDDTVAYTNIISTINRLENSSYSTEFSQENLQEVMLTELDMTNKSSLSWLSMNTFVDLENSDLEVTGIFSYGRSDIYYSKFYVSQASKNREHQAVNNYGYLYNLKYTYYFTEDLLSTFKFLHISGDNRLGKGIAAGRTTAFCSIYPNIDHSNIFFNSGMDSYLSERSLTFAGINGKGIVSPGVHVDYSPIKDLDFYFNLVYLLSERKDNTRNIGPEIDFEAYYTFLSHLKLSLELDFLFPQDFAENAITDVAYQIIVGLDIFYDSK